MFKTSSIKRTTEVLPVTPDMVPRVWRRAQKWVRPIPGFDLDELYRKLLTGQSRLWMAAIDPPWFEDGYYRPFIGLVITTVLNHPPSQALVFQRTDPALRRSLVVHLAGGKLAERWIDNAVERITKYGIEQGCRQLFLRASLGRQCLVKRFYSTAWEAVGIARDRPTDTKHSLRRNQGFYRVLIPVPSLEYRGHLYMQAAQSSSRCYIQVKENIKEASL